MQTRVLVDGVWTTQTVDLQTVLDRTRDASTTAAPAPRLDIAPPFMGVLTSTVVPSPLVRHIIPARIRHEDRNDVVFVGVSRP